MSDAPGDSPLSQADIDAAMAEAGMASESAAAPAAEEPSDAGGSDEGSAAESVAAASNPETRVDAAGNVFDEAAVAMAAAIEEERAAARHAAAPAPPAAKALDLPDLLHEGVNETQSRNIDLLRDVDLHVKIELGRSRMFVEDVLRLGQGSVVELDKLAGDPVDVLVNERLVARGEVLVLNDNFCVRINEILSTVEDVT